MKFRSPVTSTRLRNFELVYNIPSALLHSASYAQEIYSRLVCDFSNYIYGDTMTGVPEDTH